MGDMPTSSDVSRLPQRIDVELKPLAHVSLPASAAVQAAKDYWGLSDSDLDTTIGAVSAAYTQPGNPRIQNLPVWIVPANAEVMSQGPRNSPHFVTHKLCIVIDATTGKHVLSYAAGPRDWIAPSL
jgi:hypothetical protein